MEYITYIGSRESTESECEAVRFIGEFLVELGYGVRSGLNPKGIDAVATKLSTLDRHIAQLFIPSSPTFGYRHGDMNGAVMAVEHHSHYPTALNLAADMHDRWSAVRPEYRGLHARNMYCILGPELDDPSLMVIYVAPRGDTRSGVTGGTATGVALAKANDIPTYNIRFHEERDALYLDLEDMGIDYIFIGELMDEVESLF